MQRKSIGAWSLNGTELLKINFKNPAPLLGQRTGITTCPMTMTIGGGFVNS